jgi:cytochrome c peroxidase
MCDMGRGGSTGKWAELGGFRASPLRGLAAQAPYFHDGGFKTLRQVIEFFEHRFNIGLSGTQKHDLENFLSAL